jgi:hypothetical protein
VNALSPAERDRLRAALRDGGRVDPK